MKKEINNIRVKMVRMEGDIAPFVEVGYVDMYAQEHSSLMLVDSGSTANVLSCDMADSIGELCKTEDETSTITSIANKAMKTKNVKFSFALGGETFQDTFCVNSEPLPIHIKGWKVLGILGVGFLRKHRLVIDYSDFTLHTSVVNPNNLAISDCEFFFPMEIGLDHYGLPVVDIVQGDNEMVTLLDTGATNNLIAEKSVVNNKILCMCTNEKEIIKGLFGEVETEGAIVKFNLATITETDVLSVSRHANFNLLPRYVLVPSEVYSDEKYKELPPIEALLGAPFMVRQGWTLDFGAEIVYKRKDESSFKEAI